MSTFDYRSMMNQLSDKGFEHCKSLLYPILGFHYLTLTEVRKIDLCEKLYDIASRVPIKAGQRKDMVVETYYESLMMFIQNTVNCGSGTISSEYRNRALKIIRELKDKKTIDDQDQFDQQLTLFALYLSLIRATAPDFAKKNASDAHLNVDESDVELLKRFKEFRPKKEIPGFLRMLNDQSLHGNDVVYIHSIILYCIGRW